MSNSLINIEYNLTFNNTEYILTLTSTDDSMKIQLETVNESLYWKGEFEAKYIEETTNKAGSYKTFPVFLKMFMSALSRESESVFIDLMHYKQLEQVKMKKMQQNSMNMSGNVNMNESMTSRASEDPTKINKMYLIMTYNSEFEKVHYPFPLQFLIQPETDMMLRTIERMRKINISNKNNSSSTINYKDIEEIKTENFNLKNKIKLLEGQRKFGAVENEEFIRNYTSIKDEFENYKASSENKIKVFAKTIEDLKVKLSSQNLTSSSNNVETQQYIKELQSKLEKASEIVITERKQGQSFIEEKIREIEKLQKELHFMKENEKKYKVKINQLEKDLAIANKKPLPSYSTSTTKNKNYNSTPKSNYSYKSGGSVRSGYTLNSNNSGASNKKSVTNSTSSNVKKNLLTNPYSNIKGLHNKNYSPFKFFDKNKMGSSNRSAKSNHSIKSSSSIGSVDSQRNSKKYASPYNKSVTSNKSGSGAGFKKINPVPKANNHQNKFSSVGNKSGAGVKPKVNTMGSISNLSSIKSQSTNVGVKSIVKNSFTNNQNTNIQSQSNLINSINSSNKNLLSSNSNFKATYNSGSNLNLNLSTPTQNMITTNNFINQAEDNTASNKVNDISERLGRLQNMLNIAKN
jgi:hypothetical protein